MLKISVPASSANLGPGFDVLALSFKLYNVFTFEESESLEILSDVPEFCNEENLVYTTIVKVFSEFGKEPPKLKLRSESNIPMSGGLGSSASCILAGVIAANYFLENQMSEYEVYKKAIEIEGHCDNITSQFFGGLSMSIVEDGEIRYKKLNIPPGLKCTALIPDFAVRTTVAREVLPKSVTLEDAIFNMSNCLFMVDSLRSGEFENLKYFMKDRLHQDYRAPLVNNFHDIVEKAYELGAYASFLSGAGPTIMVFGEGSNGEFNEKMAEFLSTLSDNWQIHDLEVDNEGTIIEEL